MSELTPQEQEEMQQLATEFNQPTQEYEEGEALHG